MKTIFSLFAFCNTVLLSAQANLEWYASYNNETATSYGYSYDMTLDNEGNIVTCGYTVVNDSLYSMMAIVKLSPEGEQLWNFNMTLNDNYPALVRAIDINDSNEILFTGETGDTVIVGKLNPDGLLQWIEKYATNKYWNHGCDIHVTEENDILVSADCSNDTVVLLKYTNNGDLLWERFRQHQFYYGFLYTAFDDDSNTYQCFEVPGVDGYIDIEVCKYNADGDLMWVYTYSNFLLTAFARGFAISDDGCAYVLNRTIGDATVCELIKIDSVGSLAWSIFLNNFPDQDYFTYPGALTVDKGKNVIVCGEQFDDVLFSDYFNTVKFNDDGEFIWQERADYIGNTVNFGSDVITDAYGNIYTMFNNGDTIPWSSHYLMINKHAVSGDLKWSQYFEENCYAGKLLVDESIVYASVTGPGDNLYDALGVIKISQAVTTQVQAKPQVHIYACPNPALEMISFNTNADIEVFYSETYNMAGQRVDLHVTPNAAIVVRGLPAGLYSSILFTSQGRICVAWQKL